MRLATSATALCAAILLLGGAARIQEQPIDTLAWLTGCWVMKDGSDSSDGSDGSDGRGGVTEEQWMRPRAGSMHGMSRTVSDGRVVAYESLRIFTAADTLVYAATPSGQQHTEFRSTSITRDSVAFENQAHDFPQRIVYRRLGDDSLRATIEGPRNGTTRRIAFQFRRTSCDAR